MRIAMIGSRGITSNYGGIEKVLDEVCPRLVNLGHSVDVYSRADIRFENGELRSIPVKSFGGKHFENITRSALATAKAVGRYDIIHFHAIGPGMLSLLTTGLGQKSVVTIHGLDWRRAKWNRFAGTCLQLAERMLIACASRITVVSKSLEGYFRDLYGVAAHFVPNGMAEKTPVPLGAFGRSLGLEEEKYVLFASRLVPEKGCHDLIQAFCAIPTDKKLVIAGGAGEPDYIEGLKQMADPRKVIFTGHRVGDELAELFSNAYLFVLPSYIEGMSNALLEVLAYRRPVLVSDIEENAEVVEQDGFYFKTGDVPDLQNRLARLLATPADIAQMKEQIVSVRRIDWEGVALRYDWLYREMAGSDEVTGRIATPVLTPAH